MADYKAALQKELRLERAALLEGDTIHTIYFGGGTPTVMPPALFNEVLTLIRQEYPLSENVEISTEANPLLLTEVGLRALRQAGVGRLSMGMQSGDAQELKLLGRRHRLADVQQSMQFARKAGFDNINLDLIFGIPGQSLKSLQKSVDKALALQPEHLSIYSLLVEENTPLERMLREGRVQQPDPDISADMYEWLMDYLPTQEFKQYEISNWARTDALRSRHNLQYWHYQPWLGFGAGAHSYYKHQRWANVLAIPDYIQCMQAADFWQADAPPAAAELLALTEQDEIQESMMMGLRLTEEGVSASAFKQRFGKDLDEIYAKEIASLQQNGLLEWTGEEREKRLRLTRRGRMLGNQVFMKFLGE